MPDFSIDTGFGDSDPYGVFGTGSYSSIVYNDVSNSSPAESPSTTTGNGTGVFVSGDAGAGFWNTLTGALNYAIVRDQQKMTQVYPVQTMTPQAQLSVQAQASNRMLTLLMIGAGIYFLVKS
jgi:hypothetical protein